MSVIKEIREELEITQAELAEKVGVDQSTVAYWESGRYLPSTANLLKLSQVLDCSLDRLMGLNG